MGVIRLIKMDINFIISKRDNFYENGLIGAYVLEFDALNRGHKANGNYVGLHGNLLLGYTSLKACTEGGSLPS